MKNRRGSPRIGAEAEAHAGIDHLLQVALVDFQSADRAGARGIFGLLGAVRFFEHHELVGRQPLGEERVVGEARSLVAVDEHRFFAGEGGDHRDVAVLQLGEEVVADLLVAHVVQEDPHALVDHHIGVGKRDDMRAGDQVVLAALVDDGMDHLARQLRNLAVLHPDLDPVGALGGDLVDLGARRLGVR